MSERQKTSKLYYSNYHLTFCSPLHSSLELCCSSLRKPDQIPEAFLLYSVELSMLANVQLLCYTLAGSRTLS